MTLQPVSNQPGLWINPEWQEGTPGTFAVIIGVSQYPHLDGGGEPAEDFGEDWLKEAKQLGQLKVSAFTAFKVFQWLADAYRYDCVPIAKCWLLLSPTKTERESVADIDRHAIMPKLGECSRALRAWRTTIQKLPKPAQHESRALFFFSGHGLQVTHERQVLLPADYLGGDSPSWDDALSTYNLRFGMESLEIPHRFYFVDACRNDFQEIRGKGVRGQAILPEDEAANAYDNIRAAAILYATSASMQAWQPNDPANGISIYGRALLDGLRGKPDIELRDKNGVVTVGFSKLEGFVAERVVELIEGFQSNAQQPVQPSGIVRDEAITEIDKTTLQTLRPTVNDPPVRGPGDTLIVAGARSAGVRSLGVERMIKKPFSRIRTLEAAMRKRAWAEDLDVGYSLFGSERITEMWSQRLRVFALNGRSWLEHYPLLLHEVQRDQTARNFRVELEIDHVDRCGHWLQLVDEADIAHGCILPADRFDRPRFVLEFEVDKNDESARIVRLEAQLSPNSSGPLSTTAGLWQKYRNGDVTDAVSEFELSELESMVREKLTSPLAATIAALILLRANRLDLLRDWPRNLANWIEELPDGPVLWSEQVLRTQKDFPQATDYLALILRRGLPYTSEAFSYTVSLVDRLTWVADQLTSDARNCLEEVRAKTQTALKYFRPGGLFASYSHFDAADLPPGM